MKKILLILLGLAFLCQSALAGTINVHAEWTYNGADELNTLGFKMQQRFGDVTTVIATIEGKDLRVWDGDIEVEPGRSFYTLTAYGADWESDPSAREYPFEYMEPATPAYPAPTVIFRFQ